MAQGEDRPGEFDHTLRPKDMKFRFPAGKVHGLYEPGKAQKVVPVEMGDEYMRDLHERYRREHELALGTFPTVKEEHFPADLQGDGAHPSAWRGHPSAGT